MPGADWRYDGERYAEVTSLRRAEQRAMAGFGVDGRCLMRALQEELDDPAAADCGRCSVCAGPRFDRPPDPALTERAGRFLRSRPVPIEVRKMAPDAAGVMRKIPLEVRTEPGFALARFGDGGWWPAVRRGLDAGTFEDEVIAGLAQIAGPTGPAWLTVVPSTRVGETLDRLAATLAARLGIEVVPLLERTEPRPPQRTMAGAAAQAANVRGAFRVLARPPAGTGLLVDDARHSGWTLAMTGGQLRRAGAERVVPLVLVTL